MVNFGLSQEDDVGFGTFIVRCFVFLVAYSHLIPISLYVTLEILKLMQATFIKSDRDCYYAPLQKPANVKTSDLVEELGQVEFIFSDKTGTLTQNVMEFRKCSINGKIYGESNSEVSVFSIISLHLTQFPIKASQFTLPHQQ